MVASQTATILVTDLVGSTELRARLGEELAEVVRREHDHLLAQCIDDQGGTVVKGLGDGVLATFGSAADAVTAAVAIQQALDTRNRRAADPLAVRIGISGGDVSIESGDCFGTPVVEASRLCAAADGGQILVALVVRTMARGRGGHSFAALGELELKGLPEPVLAYEVAWAPASPVALLPFPPALGLDSPFGFVGRQAELATMQAAWKEASTGRRRVVLLAGELGAGKTSLAARVARDAHGNGAQVLYGRCDDEVGVPYQPFVEALRQYVAVAPSEVLEAHVTDHGSTLVRLVPELARRVPGLAAGPSSLDPETERYQLFEAVDDLLAAASVDTPIVLVVDDLHWGAKPTVLLLRHLVRSPQPAAVILIATYRDTDLGPGHPLVDALADLRRTSGVERLSIRGLTDADAIAFAEAAAGEGLDADAVAFIHQIHRETDGNPFFMGEMFRHLYESGLIRREDGRWVNADNIVLPESIREVVGRRVRALPETTRELLNAACVIGRDFGLAVLARTAGMDQDAVVGALSEAVQAGVVTESRESPGSYAFAHAVVRHSLYEQLGAAQRVRLHRRVAESLEAVSGRGPATLRELAHHWFQATPTVGLSAEDLAKAAGYAEQAARLAMASLAYEEAVGHYEHALQVLALADDPDVRCELLIGLGEAQKCAGSGPWRDTLLEAAHLAQEHGDTVRLARAAAANDEGMFSGVAVDPRRLAVQESALEALGPGDGQERARLLATLGAQLAGSDFERGRRLTEEALATARRLGDRATLAYVLGRRLYSLWVPDAVGERLAESAELLELAEQLGDPVARWFGAQCRATACIETGDTDEADRWTDEAVRAAEATGQPALRCRAAGRPVARLLRQGRLDQAEALTNTVTETALAIGEPGFAHARASVLMEIRRRQGRLEEALETALPFFGDGPAAPGFTWVLLLYAELGRDAEVQARIAAGGPGWLTDFAYNQTWLSNLVSCGAACTLLDLQNETDTIYQKLLPWNDQVVFTGWMAQGPVAYHLGELAAARDRLNDADAHFRHAVGISERMQDVYWLAASQLGWAQSLLPRRPDPARAFLDAALASARQHGFKAIETRATRLLGP